jgi:hypothetical protein
VITITAHGISDIKNKCYLSERIDIGLNCRKFNVKNAFQLRNALKQQEQKAGNCSVLISNSGYCRFTHLIGFFVLADINFAPGQFTLHHNLTDLHIPQDLSLSGYVILLHGSSCACQVV